MNVEPIQIDGWRGLGCDRDCLPRSHNPTSHERYGYERAMADVRGVVVRTGNLVINLDEATVHVDGVRVQLSSREWQMLSFLAERCGHSRPVRDIAGAIYGVAEVNELHSVDQIIWRLRGKLGSAGSLLTTGANAFSATRRLEYVEPAP